MAEDRHTEYRSVNPKKRRNSLARVVPCPYNTPPPADQPGRSLPSSIVLVLQNWREYSIKVSYADRQISHDTMLYQKLYYAIVLSTLSWLQLPSSSPIESIWTKPIRASMISSYVEVYASVEIVCSTRRMASYS